MSPPRPSTPKRGARRGLAGPPTHAREESGGLTKKDTAFAASAEGRAGSASPASNLARRLKGRRALRSWHRGRYGDGLPRIYLAGKVEEYGGYRSAMVEDQRPDLVLRELGAYESSEGDWVCSGPWFVACDHRCWHGNGNHGLGARDGGCGSPFEAPKRADVADLCLGWLERSDYVFAWIESSTAHGSFAELGWAAALGVPAFVATPSKRIATQAWFPLELGFNERRVYPDVHAAWSDFRRLVRL